MTNTDTGTTLPATVEHTIYVMLDSDGDIAVAAAANEIADAASMLTPGYRVIALTLTARPPVDAEVAVDVPDETPGDVAAEAVA